MSRLKFAEYICRHHLLSTVINNLLTADNEMEVRLWAIYVSRWLTCCKQLSRTRTSNFDLKGHPKIYVDLLKDERYRKLAMTQIHLLLIMEDKFDKAGMFMKNFVRNGGEKEISALCNSPVQRVKDKARRIMKLMEKRDFEIRRII